MQSYTSNPCFNSAFHPPSFPSNEQSFHISQDLQWKYTDRRCMQEIVPGIYIGPLSAARDTKMLDFLDIKILVAARTTSTLNIFKPRSPEKYRYEYFDIIEGSLLNSLPRVRPFVETCLSHGQKLLFYDETGNAKAAALVCSYLMESRSMDSQTAYGLIKSKRLSVCLSEHEQYQLAEYETLLKARNNIISHAYTNDELSRTGKRRRHDSDEDEQMGVNTSGDYRSSNPFIDSIPE